MNVTVPLHSLEEERTLLGERDARARAIRNRFGVSLTVRSGRVVIDGEEADVSDAVRVVRTLLEEIRDSGDVADGVLEQLLETGVGRGVEEPTEDGHGSLWLPPEVRVRSKGQEQYVRSMQRETR